jgi:hypothetical protein
VRAFQDWLFSTVDGVSVAEEHQGEIRIPGILKFWAKGTSLSSFPHVNSGRHAVEVLCVSQLGRVAPSLPEQPSKNAWCRQPQAYDSSMDTCHSMEKMVCKLLVEIRH